MFFNDFVQRRFSSVLRPWLRDEPDLELKLGFLRSRGAVKNLNFNVAALNQLLDESTRYRFKEASVRQLSIRVSYWSFPVFTLRVHGLDVKLTLGEQEAEEEVGGIRRRRNRRDTSMEDKKNSLAEIDPQGSALHDAIAKISKITTRSWGDILVTTFLKHCQLQIDETCVLLLPPSSYVSVSCSLEIKEIGVESQGIRGTCFLGGLISSFLASAQECSFDLSIRSFEIGLQRESCINHVVSSSDLFVSVKMRNLLFTKSVVYLPAVKFSFSPAELSFVVLFYSLLYKETKYTRSGRQLWRIAASRICYVISTPKLSWYRVINSVKLWFYYLHTYKNMLLIIGYPVGDRVKESRTRMFSDKTYSRLVKQHWDVISECEEELPLEVIGQARRITRFRALESAKLVKQGDPKLKRILWKVFHILSLVWAVICHILYVIPRMLHLLSVPGRLCDQPKIVQCFKGVCDDSSPKNCFFLALGKLSISFCPEKEVLPYVHGLPHSALEFSSDDLISFHVSFDAILIKYLQDFIDHHVIFTCGCAKVASSVMENGPDHLNKRFREQRNKKILESGDILWCDPAKGIEMVRNHSFDNGVASIPLLEFLVGKMWMNWKKALSNLGTDDFQISEAPCILSESRCFLIDQTADDPTSGFCEDLMVVGKLNIVLGNSSVLSLAVLLGQIQKALWEAGCWNGENIVLNDNASLDNPSELDSCSGYKSLSGTIETAMVRMVPQKKVQVGLMIAGPRIRLLLKRDKFHGGSTESYLVSRKKEVELSFDIDDIELLVSPILVSKFAVSSGSTVFCDDQSGSLRVEEPEISDIPKPTNETYSCQGCVRLSAYLKFNGLKAYLCELSGNPGYNVVTLSTTTIRSTLLRKDCHSFGSAILVSSAALHLLASGFTAIVFVDELSVLVEVFYSSYYNVLHALNFFASSRDLSFQEILRKDKACTGSGSDKINRGKCITLVSVQSSFRFKNTCELHSVDIVLQYSRKSHNRANYTIKADALTSHKLDMGTVLDCGIYVCIPLTRGKFSFEDGIAELFIDLSGFQSVIVRCPTENTERFHQFAVRDLLLSMNRLLEASLSHCKFYLCMENVKESSTPACQGNGADASSSCKSLCIHENFNMVIEPEKFMNESFRWLSTNISLGDIYLADCTLRNMLVKKHNSHDLNASFSIGEGFRTFCCKSQGGSIYVETEAALVFFRCLSLYHRLIEDLLASVSSQDRRRVAQCGETLAAPDNKLAQDIQQLQENKWHQMEAFSLIFSQFTLAFVARDEFGRFQEILFEANALLNIEVSDMLRKVSFEISKFSIMSQSLNDTAEQQDKEIQISHLSATPSDDLSSTNVSGDPSVITEHRNAIKPALHGSYSMSNSFPRNEPCAENLKDSQANDGEARIFYLSPQNCILKELCVVIAVEWPMEGDWRDPFFLNQFCVGNGSISGFDMNVSLTQLQMMLSAVESCSGARSEEKTDNLTRRHFSMNQKSEESLEGQVPDGIIVAIEDVYQHTYIAVEDAESGYDVVGTTHCSLVGEKALFRVKHHNAGIWKPGVQYFSLISLYAKDTSGEPLRLNGQSGSDFVDVSMSTDGAWALWSILPYRPLASDGYSDWESDCFPTKNTFYLVNKKKDQSLAFINGVLEFVRKPGNPFKCKLFHDLLPPVNSSVPDLGTIVQYDSHTVDNREFRNGAKRGMTIVVHKATLTILHELSDTTEKFPLLQGSVSSTEIIFQISKTKARFMTCLEIMLLYFDSQRNLWQELVSPLEICIFFRYRFLIQGSESALSRVPGHFYVRINELNIFLSELSLDVLLFVIGKLKLAGPFAVRSSVILANCCKVENKSGLTLLCQFFDGQHAIIVGRQTSTLCLRHLALSSQSPEASNFSIQLADKGLSTSLIHLSLLEARAFAWRTHIVSSQESKTFPGPFIVVEVSRRNEDGLSVVVSPLLRIHNETDFSMELRFQRPQDKEIEFSSLILEAGGCIDDLMATFDGITLSGDFLFSFRPRITDSLLNVKVSSVEWSHDLRGGKPVPLSGIFDKLSYQVRTAFAVESVRCAFGTARCAVKSEGGQIANIYFLIQAIERDVPVIQPDNLGYASANANLPDVLHEAKEIFILPTVHVYNLLELDIHVNLTDADPQAKINYDNVYSQTNIPCGSSVNLYANPANIFFIVTLITFNSSCKPVNSSQWAKKLQKQKSNANYLDIELDFGGGKYYAFLRLSRGYGGILEARIYASYTLRNDTQFPLCCFAGSHKPLSRDEVEKLGSRYPPELGAFLPPNSRRSWFMKCHKIRVKMVAQDEESEAILNLDALSSLTEIDLEAEEKSGVKNVTKLGVSLMPSSNRIVSSLIVSFNPRHVVLNESEELIFVRQCYMEDDMQGIIAITSKQRAGLKLQNGPRRNGQTTVFENLLRKHSKPLDDTMLFIQFRPNDANFSWSGPVCVASLGHFFLKFRKSLLDTVSQPNCTTSDDPNSCKFAAVHVVEEDSTLVLHFYWPPNADLPYRIENCLQDTSVTYYQKDSLQPEILGSGCCVDYVWDDLTLPHKLVVQIDDVHLFREINLDKVHAWKPFHRAQQQRGMGFHFSLDMKPGEKNGNGYDSLISTVTMKLGYEVYAEGLIRVLRICAYSGRRKDGTIFHSSTKIRFRISYFALQLLELAKGEDFEEECKPIIVARLENIDVHSMFTDQHKVNCITVQSLTVDQKRPGAPFASMLRKNQSQYNDTSDNMLRVVLVLLSSSSTATHIKYLSIILLPLDVNLDEETLMRIVPFWRKSLSDPNASSRQYYLDHFEIQPVKIVASFLPGDLHASYTSTQEMLRSLLHSVIKIPTIKNKIVELNGVLITHALTTLRELSIKCAQHYSWYAMRAIYIAKGSPLLPPAFASMFDDFSSSSLDVFFDPSSGMINLPGLTMGTFKFISKCINGKGFSGTKRYFGDLGKTLKLAGSNMLFAAVTEVSDSILKGAETNGFNGMMRGFHQGILKLAMEPSLLGSAFMEGGPDRKIMLDRAPGVDELYIEGYLQALLDAFYKQEYLRVRVIDNQVILKNLPPNSTLINEIVDRVKGFLVSKALLKGDSRTTSHSLRHIRAESDWRIGPTLLTLFEHLFVSFAIRMLRRQAGKFMARVNVRKKSESDDDDQKAVVPVSGGGVEQKVKLVWRSGIGRFVLSGIVAYIDGRLCRSIQNPIARRVVSGFLLSFLDKDEE